MSRWDQKIVAVLFWVALVLPLAGMFLGQQQSVSMAEKRKLAVFPSIALNGAAIENFPPAFETYFNDHFGFRQRLITLHNWYKVFVLRTSPVADVVIGRDGWLFFNQNHMIEDYMGLDAYSGQELENTLKAFRERAGVSGYFGSRYLFVLAPNKQSVYPEYLPLSIRSAAGVTKADQLMTLMRAVRAAPFLDLRPVLRSARERFPSLYLTKDTHWNQRGAFLAYQAVIKTLRHDYPDLPMVTEQQLDIRTGLSRRGDLAEMMGVKKLMPEETRYLGVAGTENVVDQHIARYLKKYDDRYAVKYKRPQIRGNPQGKLDVVLFRDSFSTDMIPFYANTFRTMVIFYEPFNVELLGDLVGRGGFKPDVVIEEMIERSL